jgi:hypothetical protein
LNSAGYYKYCTFDSDNSILYHEVNDENFGSKESFVISMSQFISILDEIRPKNLIIKVLKKPEYFELELKTFLQTTLHKLVKDLHIEKIAFFIFHEGYIEDLKKFEATAITSARFFSDFEDAKRWVIRSD